MNNMRIVSDNAIDRATLSASSQASTAMAPSNLTNDRKSNVWRSTGTTARLTALWSPAETLGCVALPFCNLSASATMRVRVTNEASATNLALYSQQFSAGTWQKNAAGGSITPSYGYAAGPDGTAATATRFVFSAANQDVSQTTTLGVGVTATSSMWVKGTSGQTIALTCGGVNQLFTLDGTWQRLVNDNKTSINTIIGVNTYMGATARDILVWGAQLETGPVATSYYATTSSAATRPLGYIDAWQSYTHDSGVVPCCAAGVVQPRGFTPAQAASAYAFGGGSSACLWLPQTPAFGLAVDISDPANAQGYIEAARLVAGSYWSPAHNPDWGGASTTVLDTGKNFRTESGDLVSNIGTKARKLTMSLKQMPATDRTALFSILRANGISYPMLVSLYPQDTDAALERDHMVYGKLTALAAMTIDCWNGFSNSLDFEQV